MSAAPISMALPLEAQADIRRPRWWREVFVIVWLCWAYDAVTSLTPFRPVAAYDHARSVLHLEQVLHLDPEHALDQWLAPHHILAYWVSNYYDNAHFIVTLGVIGWLWWRHSALYRPLRTSLVLINVIGLFVFWRYPMAPPRLAVPTRYVDVVAASHAFGSWHSGVLAREADQFAAMPSLHLAWAAWSAFAVWRVFRSHRWAWLVWLYPLLTGFAVMATGNHFLADCVAGILVTVVASFAAERSHEWWEARRAIRQMQGGQPRYRRGWPNPARLDRPAHDPLAPGEQSRTTPRPATDTHAATENP